MSKSTICLFFSDTGGGHRSAAEAVEAGIQSIITDFSFKEIHSRDLKIVCENVVEKSHFINRFFVQTYNFLLRHNQRCMKYYYWFVHQFNLNDSDLGYALVKPYAKQLMQSLSPSVVVSLHPMINQYVARILKELGGAKPRFIVVVTDPNDRLWRGWACQEADMTIVPNLAAKNKLLSWGVAENKLAVVGMPIHPDFLTPPASDRQTFLRHLGLNPDIFTICINAGWAGGGNMPAIYKALAKVKRNIQVIFLCGNHKKLYRKALAMASASAESIPTRVLPFHDNMAELMNAVDLMVTKAGGLTTFEALARKLPLAIDILTKPMPQEAGTIDILVEADKHTGLTKLVKKPEDIIKIVEKAKMKSYQNLVDLPSYQSLNRVDAVYDIAKIILSYVKPAKTKVAQTK